MSYIKFGPKPDDVEVAAKFAHLRVTCRKTIDRYKQLFRDALAAGADKQKAIALLLEEFEQSDDPTFDHGMAVTITAIAVEELEEDDGADAELKAVLIETLKTRGWLLPPDGQVKWPG
jgi:hypothetical protein